MQVIRVVIIFSILAGFFVYSWSFTWSAIHYGHNGSIHFGDLHILVIEYYWCVGQGTGIKPGADDVLIEEKSPQALLLVDIFDSIILNIIVTNI